MRRTLAAFGVSAAIVAVALYLLDPAALLAQLAGVAPLPVLGGLLAVLLAVVCWAESMRRVALAAGATLAPVQGFVAYGTGMFAKQVLPMGNAGGIPIMAAAMDREMDVAYNRTLAVVTVGDFMGLVSSLVLAVAGVVAVVLTLPPTRLVRGIQVAVAVTALALAAVAILLLYRRSLVRYAVLGIARLVRAPLGRVSDRAAGALAPERVGAGLQRYFETIDAVAADRRALAVAFALSLSGWTLFAVPLYAAALAVGSPISFGLVLFVVPAGGLATVVPLPGGLGGVELAVGGAILALTAIPPVVVAAMVVVYRLCVYWFLLAIGGACVAYSAASLGTIAAEASEESAPDPSAR